MKFLLNGIYGCIHGSYWMSYGVIASFSSAFLLTRGYSNSDIGLILAIGSIVSVIAQPLTADLADRSKRISLIGITQIISTAILVFTAVTFFITGKMLALSVVFVMMVAGNAVLQPLFNSLAFKLEESGIHIYFGATRSIGSLAYSVLCASLGVLVERHGGQVIPVSGVIIMAALLLSLSITKKLFKKACMQRDAKIAFGESVEAAEERIIEAESKAIEKILAERQEAEGQEEINLLEFVRRNKLFVIAHIGIAGIFFSNSVYNNFMLQIAESVGGNSVDLGRILSVMAFSEIPAMLFYDKIQQKIPCRAILAFSAVGFSLKALCMYCAQSVTLLYLANVMNIISFGLFLPAIVYFVNMIMEKGEAVKGQAMFPIVNSIATVISSLLGGIILDVSGAKMLMLVCLVFCAGGTACFCLLIGKIKPRKAIATEE